MSISGSAAVPPLAEHPLLRALGCIEDDLDGVAELDPTYLPTSDKARTLAAIQRQLSRLEGLRLQVLAAAGDVAEAHAARSAGVWLAGESRADARTGVGDQRAADRLARWPVVLEALRAGLVSPVQAQVITRALEELPDDLDRELVAKATARLVADAGHFTPRELRVLGRRVLEAIAPDRAEAHEHALLVAEEDRARAETRLVFRPRGDGVTDVYARLPDPVADRLRTYLDAHTSPRRTHLTHPHTDAPADAPADAHPTTPGGPGVLGDVDRLPLPRRRGEAFCTLLEHTPTDALPRHGGTATSVVVTIDHDQLVAQDGVAQLSTGGQLTAGQARRLACTADILPAVLDGKSEVLDLGRSRRLFTTAQRKALALRDRRCRAEGCEIPAAWCEAHHLHPWSRGGPTDLSHGILLCSHHHHRAHHPHWTTSRLPTGDLRYHRRT